MNARRDLLGCDVKTRTKVMHSAANAPETASDPRLRFPNWTANDTQIGHGMQKIGMAWTMNNGEDVEMVWTVE